MMIAAGWRLDHSDECPGPARPGTLPSSRPTPATSGVLVSPP